MAHPTLRWFQSSHLHPSLQMTVDPFRSVAFIMDETLPDGAEKSTVFRKLLEAKDAAVRAAIEGQDAEDAQ